MNVLGIAGYNHDAAAALVQDGKLIAAAEEERFTRVKHQGGLPSQAIAYCLKAGSITEKDLHHVVYANDLWGLGGLRRIAARAQNLFTSPLYATAFIGRDLYNRAWITFLMRTLAREGHRPKFHYLNHHLAHMASAFLPSPFETAALFSIDSMGDGDTTILGVGRDSEIKKLKSVYYPNALAEMYCCVTNYLGFKTQDEYKVMGLASYGEPRFYDSMKNIVHLMSDGRYRLDTRYFMTPSRPGRFSGYVSQRFIDEFGPARKPEQDIDQRHKDLAASLQKVYEESIFHCLRHLHQLAGDSRLCLSGGGAQNSVMAGKILEQTPFTKVYVPPSPGDSGGAIGAALLIAHTAGGAKRSFTMRDAYWGPSFSDREIATAIQEAKVAYRRVDDPAREAAALLAEGKILGWFQGRMEFGPRALGSRSILADPTRPDMTEVVNRWVKHREDFRPFAPSVLKNRRAEYFDDVEESPFMSFVARVKPSAKSAIPAVVHVDGTARLQTLEQDVNPLYCSLIEEFEKRKGVPVVLNTSFNVKGEPIVCTPRDALRCFYSTGLDCLVAGSFVLEKPHPMVRG